MRNRIGQLVGDLNSTTPATASVSAPPTIVVGATTINDSRFESIELPVNENETEYALFPYEINDPPILKSSIYRSSIPKIIHVNAHSPSKSGVMYHDEDGVVKVLAGTTILLSIDATQPIVWNVENGIPTLIESKAGLTYEWQYNGVPLSETVLQTQDNELNKTTAQLLNEDPTLRKDFFQIYNNKLLFKNITERFAGVYTCVISNDVGEITSEPVELQIVHTNKPEESFFRRNLIKNGFGIEGTSEWTTLQGAVAAKAFALPEAEAELKKPHTAVFQHSINEIYPHPININFNSVKDYNFEVLTKNQGFYFCRDQMTIPRRGGRPQAAVYQDVDLTEIQDLIAGKVFGCDGVRAYAGCILGNGISYRPVDVLVRPNRHNPNLYYNGAPRLSYENMILTGFPMRPSEAIKVIIQEFEGNTPLSSVYYNTETQQTTEEPGIVLTDKISSDYSNPNYKTPLIARPSYLDRFRNGGTDPVTGQSPAVHLLDYLESADGIGPTIDKGQSGLDWLKTVRHTYTPAAGLEWIWPPDTIEITNQSWLEWIGPDPTRIYNMYKKLYSRPEEYYTYGQYAEYKDAIIRILNPRTNKIRITVVFDMNSGDLQDNFEPADDTLYQPGWIDWDTPMSKFGNSWGNAITGERSVKQMWQTALDNYADDLYKADKNTSGLTSGLLTQLQNELATQQQNLANASPATAEYSLIASIVSELGTRIDAEKARLASGQGSTKNEYRRKAGENMVERLKEVRPQLIAKAMATAFGLILDPITYTSPEVEDFRQSIARIPNRTEDLIYRPASLNVLGYPDASSFLAAALSTQ